MFKLAEELWPYNRSLSGDGLRLTLSTLKRELPELNIQNFKSGDKVFDWEVPDEWVADEAYIVSPTGERFCDFRENNLHLVGYSTAFEGTLPLEVLEKHLHSLPGQPDAIPYVTSYYEKTWGFCLTENLRKSLTPGQYKVVVKTKHLKGQLDYGELLIPGISKREIFFSTYVCHPSMANNELSGPVLAVALAKKLQKGGNFYTYRFVFIPETIGSLAYMSKNLDFMKREILAGFVLTCVGDERTYSYVPSRNGSTVADKLALETLRKASVSYKTYSWLHRGSDERQYCSPGADLPFCSMIRSKYHEYPEYHTSLDKLGDVVTVGGLQSSFELYEVMIDLLENKRYPKGKFVGEPNLGKRGLYPTLSKKGVYRDTRSTLNFLSFSDGGKSVEEIASLCNMDSSVAQQTLQLLIDHDLVSL